MANNFKPAATKGRFQHIIDLLWDGAWNDVDSDDENRVADYEAEQDLDDTQQGAAVLNSIRKPTSDN